MKKVQCCGRTSLLSTRRVVRWDRKKETMNVTSVRVTETSCWSCWKTIAPLSSFLTNILLMFIWSINRVKTFAERTSEQPKRKHDPKESRTKKKIWPKRLNDQKESMTKNTARTKWRHEQKEAKNKKKPWTKWMYDQKESLSEKYGLVRRRKRHIRRRRERKERKESKR